MSRLHSFVSGLCQGLENIIKSKNKSSSSNGQRKAADREAICCTNNSWTFTNVVVPRVILGITVHISTA